MKSDILKELALKAKNRLIHKNIGENSDNKSDYRIKIIKSGDDIFYDKVKRLLEREDEVINPIKELMDDGLLSAMTSCEKEKYLLETVDKYNRFRNLIEDEKSLKFGF